MFIDRTRSKGREEETLVKPKSKAERRAGETSIILSPKASQGQLVESNETKFGPFT
jgi:hypothetical protein